MKSKNVLRRITSCALAASLCMTSIIPSYAADLSMEAQTEDVSTETVETTEESTESWSNPSQEPLQEAEEPSTDAKPAEAETDAYDPYILLLPVLDGVTYTSVDEAHKDADLSTDAYTILLYEEGEQVALTVESDMEFSVIDAETQKALIEAEDIEDGKLSFTMPKTDLTLQFVLPEEESEVTNPAEEAETEALPAEETATEESPVALEEETVVPSVDSDPKDETEAVTEAAVEPETESIPETVETESMEEDTESETETGVSPEFTDDTVIGAEDGRYNVLYLASDAFDLTFDQADFAAGEEVHANLWHPDVDFEINAMALYEDGTQELPITVYDVDEENLELVFIMPDADVFFLIGTEAELSSEEILNLFGTAQNSDKYTGEFTSPQLNYALYPTELTKDGVRVGTGKKNYQIKNSSGKVVASGWNGFCLNPQNATPTTGTVSVKKSTTRIAKALFLLYGGSGWNTTITGTDGVSYNLKNYIDKQAGGTLTTDEYYAFCHILAAYAYGDSNYAFGYASDGVTTRSDVLNDKGQKVVTYFEKMLKNMPSLSTPKFTFSGDYITPSKSNKVSSPISGDTSSWYKTNTVTYVSTIKENTASFKLSNSGIYCQVGNKVYAPGDTVTVSDGDTFFFLAKNGTTGAKEFSVKTALYTQFFAYVMDADPNEMGSNPQDVGFTYTSTDKITLTAIFEEFPEDGQLQVKKVSTNNGGSVPDEQYYSFKNAKFQVLDSSGSVVATLTTGANGVTETVTLPAATYTIKEIAAPKGYKLSDKTPKVNVLIDQLTTFEFDDPEETGSLEINKKLDPELPGAIKVNYDLSEIEFKLTYVANPNIVIPRQHPDKDGHLVISNLYYGDWILEETKAPEYHQAMEPQVVTVNGTAQIENLVNYRYEAWLEIVKKDAVTGSTITDETRFRIKDENGNFVSLKVKNDDKDIESVDLFETDERGRVNFEEAIPGGKYTLTEVRAPYAYDKTSDIPFEVTENRDENHPIEIVVNDPPRWGSVKVLKYDAASGNTAGAGFKFNIIADEDITDSAGTAYYEKGTQVDQIVTGADGTATSSEPLYLGTYHIEEDKDVPAGYLWSDKQFQFEVTNADANHYDTPVTVDLDGVDLSFEDQPVTRPIDLYKVDSVSKNGAGGNFVFEIIAKDVKDGGGNVRGRGEMEVGELPGNDGKRTPDRERENYAGDVHTDSIF